MELRLNPDNQPYLLVPINLGNDLYGEGAERNWP